MPTVKHNEVDGAPMVFVPASEFLMGSDDGRDDEKPQRRVYLDDYWIYQYPVTVEQYMRFCRETHRSPPSRPRWGWRADHPVVNVSWDDATAYCIWAGVWIPTEAEWEKAARGTGGREYPWGNEWDSKCCRSDAKWTSPVTAHPSGESPYGAWDMAGDVWEWCTDWYFQDYYQCGQGRNPRGPQSGQYRVVRGGGWYFNNEYGFRCACRFMFDQYGRLEDTGFRCVLRQCQP